MTEWDPFGSVEDDREHLERVADVRHVAPDFPRELLTTDPLVAREAVRRAKAEKVRERTKAPIPPPETPWRAPTSGDPVPRAASRTHDKAVGQGWSARLLFGRGPWLGSTDRTAQADLALLGMQRSGERIVARWRDGKFDSGRHFSPYRTVASGPNWVPISSRDILKALEAE